HNAVFNIQPGSYAKTIHLSPHNQPHIYHPIPYPPILHNLNLHQQPVPHYTHKSLTHNTPPPYPIHNIHNILLPSIPRHANTIIF
ncbi:phosphoenolpyruvate carboxykinase (ATP), partial [Macrococcoides caseolyticum]|uniref:phosphoenolpyruvate carboxykinase (ATP) n=1 Tax=Macrococcoides caseolyticum TaxID=69966 RepID=UPI00119DD5BB